MIGTLEAKRKVKSAKFHDNKKKMEVCETCDGWQLHKHDSRISLVLSCDITLVIGHVSALVSNFIYSGQTFRKRSPSDGI